MKQRSTVTLPPWLQNGLLVGINCVEIFQQRIISFIVDSRKMIFGSVYKLPFTAILSFTVRGTPSKGLQAAQNSGLGFELIIWSTRTASSRASLNLSSTTLWTHKKINRPNVAIRWRGLQKQCQSDISCRRPRVKWFHKLN